jgi:hypothetical protein
MDVVHIDKRFYVHMSFYFHFSFALQNTSLGLLMAAWTGKFESTTSSAMSYRYLFSEKRSVGIKFRNKETFRYGIPAYTGRFRALNRSESARAVTTLPHTCRYMACCLSTTKTLPTICTWSPNCTLLVCSHMLIINKSVNGIIQRTH